MDNTMTATLEHDRESRSDTEHPAPDEHTPWTAPRTRRVPWRAAAAALGVALLLLGCVVLATVFGWKLKDRGAVDTASGQALAAARQYAVTLTSIDADHFDQDLAAVTNGATGGFKQMYTQSAQQLKPLLLQAKSDSKGQVVDAAVESASTKEVVVMLFVDSTITNTSNPTPRVDRNRIVMTMDNVDGRWLASKVDLP